MHPPVSARCGIACREMVKTLAKLICMILFHSSSETSVERTLV